MEVEKKVIGSLNKCYSLARLEFDGKKHLACAAEKEDPAYLFDEDGNFIEKLWDGPGGVMTMEQYPGKVPTLLATYKFYSPNNSADAKIMYYCRVNGEWKPEVLCDLPFVHRFGVLESCGKHYLIACALKSSHAFKNDWTAPGRIWVAELPEDLSVFNAENQLQLTPLVSGLLKNHGFCKTVIDGVQTAVVGTECGIWTVAPPTAENAEWKAEKISDLPASDMLFEDFDGDGERELLVLAPFHGDDLAIYKKIEGTWKWVWRYSEPLPFLHAIYAGEIGGKKYAFVGNREGNRDFLAISFDESAGSYKTDRLDAGAGAANCLFFTSGKDAKLIAANRETDEIALYTIKD